MAYCEPSPVEVDIAPSKAESTESNASPLGLRPECGGGTRQFVVDFAATILDGMTLGLADADDGGRICVNENGPGAVTARLTLLVAAVAGPLNAASTVRARAAALDDVLELAVTGSPRASGALVDAGKYDYLFGDVASNAHNAARSAQNAQQLARIGIHDNAAGRALLQSHFDDVVASSDNVLRSFSNSYGTFEVRESLFAGPGGFVKLESTWQVTDDGLRLTTVIPIGG